MIAATGGRGWRIAGWGLLAGLLALPAGATVYGDTGWTAFDFAAAAALLGTLGIGAELAARGGGGAPAKLGMALALLTGFLLVWINLAVGVIGSERNDANLLFAGVLAVAAGGAILARLQPAGMARTMYATAGAHSLVGGMAVALGLGGDGHRWPWDVAGSTLVFTGLWLAAAALFGRAARAG